MTINACFEQMMQLVMRDTMYTAWALEPFMMFMNNNATFKKVPNMGRADDCYLKFENVNIPKPVEEECCDPDECFGPLKETQFNIPSCESYVYKAQRISSPIGLACSPAEAYNHGLLGVYEFQKKFMIYIASIMPKYILSQFYTNNVWACDHTAGSKRISYVEFAENKVYTLGAGGINKKNLMALDQKFIGIEADILMDGIFIIVPSSYYVNYINNITDNVNCCDFTIIMPDGTKRKANRKRFWTQDSLSNVVVYSLPDEYFKVDASNKPIMPMGAISGLYAGAMSHITSVGYNVGHNMTNPVSVNFGRMSMGYAGLDNDINYHLASKMYMWTYLFSAYFHPKGLAFVIGNNAITVNAGKYPFTLPSSPPVVGSDEMFFVGGNVTDTVNLQIPEKTRTIEQKK